MKKINDVFAELQEEVQRNQEVCLWMSFSDSSGFLGVVVTNALGIIHATNKTHEMSINPGGKIKTVEIDPDNINPKHFDRLLSKTDLIEAGYINK